MTSFLTEGLIVLRHHLAAVHRNEAAWDLTFAEAQDQHYHEHFGPGGLRNHDHDPKIPAIEEPMPGGRDEALQELVEKVNGFVYAGDRLNSVMKTVEALRRDPELRAKLFTPRRRVRRDCCGQKLCIFDDRGAGQQGPCWENV